MGSRRWSNVTKIIVVATLVVLGISIMVTFRAMIAPTVVAFLLAFILSYPVNWLQRNTGWARGAIVAVIYVALLALLILTPVLVIPRSAEILLSLRVTLEQLSTSLQSVSTGPSAEIRLLPIVLGYAVSASRRCTSQRPVFGHG